MQIYLRFRHDTAAAVDVTDVDGKRYTVTLWREDMYQRFRYGETLDASATSVKARPDIVAAAVELANR